MDTITFLQKILPQAGPYCAAVFTNGLKAPPRHKYTNTIEDLAAYVLQVDARGLNVFHACASFLTTESRKQTNTAAMRSFWLDLDVKDGAYASQRDAAQAILTFCLDLGIPAPLLVSSGRGVHCYWPLTEDMASAEWKHVADTFALCLNNRGVMHDPTRTADQASVLRPVGTHHRKAEPIPVRLVKDAAPMQQDAFVIPVLTYASQHGLMAVRKDARPVMSALSAGMEVDYPPSSGETAATHCPAMAQMRDTQGDVGFDQWRGIIGVLKFCTDGEALAEQWTELREQAGRDRSDWQYQYSSWNAGPATCDQIAKSCEACGGCQFRGKVKSPIQLGYSEVAPSKPITVVEETVVDNEVKEVEVQKEVDLPKGFRWDGAFLTRLVKAKDESGNEVVEWVPFCRMLVEVKNRVRDLDGRWGFLVLFHTHHGSKPVEAVLPTEVMADDRALFKALASYEAISLGKQGRQHMHTYITEELQRLREKRAQVSVFPHQGWQAVDNEHRGPMTGEFVLGDKVYRARQTPAVALLHESVYSDFRKGLGQQGNVADWSRQVNYVYNRPGAQPWQMAFAVAFGAPLVRLVGGLWHGIPYVMFGTTGTSKSTTAQVAASIYGKPDVMFSVQYAKSGDTVNATIAKMSSVCNLPLVLDELSGRTQDELQSLLYALAAGAPRARCATDGSIIENRAYWDTMFLATSNTDVRELIKGIEDPVIQEAVKHRMVQVTLDKGQFEQVFAGINPARDIDNALITSNFGVAGPVYLQFLVNNLSAVQAKLRETMEAFKVDDRDSAPDRYFKWFVVTALTGAAIAKRLGLIDFDINALQEWARETIIHQRSDIHDWDLNIAAFFSSLQGRVLKTKNFVQMRGRPSVIETPMDRPMGTTEVAARISVNDRQFWVDTAYMKEWAADNRLSYNKLVNEMVDRGYIIPVPGAVRGAILHKKHLGAGTTAIVGRCSAVQIRYSKVYPDEDSVDMEAPDNVVPLQATSGT